MVSDEALTINGQFTQDLDLTYSPQDVEQLFNYFYKDYEAICELALEIFRTSEDELERLMELNEELISLEYNYLSEDEHVRRILFNVCILNVQMSEDDRKLFHSATESWNNLFN